MEETSPDPLTILSPEDRLWYGEWLSESQMREAIRENLDETLDVIDNILEIMRSRVENGYPPTGPLWEEPSAEETQRRIDELKRRRAAIHV